MSKVPVALERKAALTTEEAETLPPGQAHWWLRRESEFVRLPRRVRGDQPLDEIVHLEPGDYILGVGPPGSGVREDLHVEPRDEAALQTTASPEVQGMTFVLTGDLETMDRDAASAWLTAAGARVTSSVSRKTNYLVVGREPGMSKVAKAQELGIPQLTESELQDKFGFPKASASPQRIEANTTNKVAKLLDGLEDKAPDPNVEKIIGPSHFADLGMLDSVLWGIAIGPRGGNYSVHIDLNDRPQWGIRCSCGARNRPCKHGLALLYTAARHFIPPAPAPEGHREASRYNPSWE